MYLEVLEDVQSKVEIRADIEHVVSRSFLDSSYSTKWCPVRMHRVTNKALYDQYEEKKQELVSKGRKGDELEERYGFVVETASSSVEMIASLGLQTHDSDYNSLGYNRLGVYVCKHADVCLQHAIVKHSGCKVIRLIVVKYVLGRYTTAIPRVASATEFIEPTIGFDSHISVMTTSRTDSLQDQYDRSQVYLYEVNRMQQFVSRPRHVLPFAVVTYTIDGNLSVLSEVGSETPEQIASNVRLQAIVRQINTRSDTSTSVASLPAPPAPPSFMQVSPPSISPGASLLVQSQQTIVSAQSVVPLSGNQPKVAISAGSVGASGARIMSPEVERIVSQINSRHENLQVSKTKSASPPVSVRPAHGMHRNLRTIPEAGSASSPTSGIVSAASMDQAAVLRALSPQAARVASNQQQFAYMSTLGGNVAMLQGNGLMTGTAPVISGYADPNRLAGLPVNFSAGHLLSVPGRNYQQAVQPGYQLAQLATNTAGLVLPSTNMYAQYGMSGGLIPVGGGYYALPSQDAAATQLFRLNSAAGLTGQGISLSAGQTIPNMATATQGLPLALGTAGLQGFGLSVPGISGQSIGSAGFGGMTFGVQGLSYPAVGVYGNQLKRGALDAAVVAAAEKRMKYA